MNSPSQRVLIVDDSPYACALLGKMMEDHGYQVAGSAGSVADAVKLFGELKPDFVTMDLVMPDGGGVEAIKAFYEIDPKARIIVVSGVAGGIGESQVAAELGVSTFVQKPIRWPDLERAISQVSK